MAIRFFTEDISYDIKHKRMLRAWLASIVAGRKKECGEISYIYCSDDFLLGMNKHHLRHDYYTDVITFDYCSGDIVSGDIFISIDRVRDNAGNLHIDCNNELHRVMVHGLLHLLGFSDKSPIQKSRMTAMENKCLSMLKP